jgi:hypothetical protein
MLSYILETARDVCKSRPDAGFDEIAAVAGVKAEIVQSYFATEADLRARIALAPAERAVVRT